MRRGEAFTDVLDAKDPADLALFPQVVGLAEHRGAAFFPAWLTCDVRRLHVRVSTT